MSEQHDNPMTVGEVCNFCESKPSPQTVSFWCNVGIKVGDQRVKLARKRIGGRYVYYRSQVEEFLRRLNDE